MSLPTTHDARLRGLLERGLAQARARGGRDDRGGDGRGPPRPAGGHAPLPLVLASDRACVESNLASKGLWPAGTGAGGGELVRLPDATDQQRGEATGPAVRRDPASWSSATGFPSSWYEATGGM